MSEESNANGPQEGEGVGAMLRKARIESDMDINKICADLRISPQALEALEQGNYHQLPGDPYIRALLGSLGRYLGLDSQALVQRYNREIGAVHSAPSIAPYKDRTSTHASSHKQIFIVIFAVLIVILIVLINQLKKSEPAGAPPPAPAASAVPADSLPSQPDTLVSKSLAPDSGASRGSPDSGEIRGSAAAAKPSPEAPKAAPRADSAAAAKPAVPPAGTPVPGANLPAPGAQAAPAAPAPPPAGAAAPAPSATAGLHSAIVKPLIDSVGVRVVRSGKEDFATLLRLGKQMQVSHTDTIVVMVSKRKSVEVTVEGKTVIPERKRFKIFGNTVKTF